MTKDIEELINLLGGVRRKPDPTRLQEAERRRGLLSGRGVQIVATAGEAIYDGSPVHILNGKAYLAQNNRQVDGYAKIGCGTATKDSRFEIIPNKPRNLTK